MSETQDRGKRMSVEMESKWKEEFERFIKESINPFATIQVCICTPRANVYTKPTRAFNI